MRPNDILDYWGVPELLVAFGEYANEDAEKNYQDWKGLDAKTRSQVPMPSKYVVYFHKED